MDEQARNQLIGTLYNQGMSLSDIQELLKEKHGLHLTYMEMRMITAELETLDWARIEPVAQKPSEEPPTLEAAPPQDGCLISVSKIVRPGYMMSGDVSFPSGIVADWFVDQSGRLSFDTKDNEKPSQEELVEFQQKLQRIVSDGGMPR